MQKRDRDKDAAATKELIYDSLYIRDQTTFILN